MITNLLKKIYVNTKARCKPRNTTNFNQKVKMLKLKTLNFRYDIQRIYCKAIYTIIVKLYILYSKANIL